MINIAPTSGIYTITNILNGKMYVGYAKNMYDRLHIHTSKLRYGIHPNEYLQNAWNKEGGDNFIFEVLEECEERFLASQEHYWATLLNTHNRQFGYNIKPTHPDIDNKKHSKETKLKMSLKKTGQKYKSSPNVKGVIPTMLAYRLKPVEQLNEDNIVINNFKTIEEAHIKLGICLNSVRKICSGQKSRLKLKLRYKNG